MNDEYRDSPPQTGNAGFEVSIPASQLKHLFPKKKGWRTEVHDSRRNKNENQFIGQTMNRGGGVRRIRSDPSEIIQFARITEAMSSDPCYFPSRFDDKPSGNDDGKTFHELRDNARVVNCNKLVDNDDYREKAISWGIPRVFTSRDECDADGKHVDGVLVLPPGGKKPIYLVANIDENTSPSKVASALTDVLLAHSRPDAERLMEQEKIKRLRHPGKSSLKSSTMSQKISHQDEKRNAVDVNDGEKHTDRDMRRSRRPEKNRTKLSSNAATPSTSLPISPIKPEFKLNSNQRVQHSQFKGDSKSFQLRNQKPSKLSNQSKPPRNKYDEKKKAGSFFRKVFSKQPRKKSCYKRC